MEECVFCKIVAGEITSEKVLKSKNFIVIKDASPISEGHVLIIPKKHYVTILNMPNELGSEVIELIKKIGGDWVNKKDGNGFNLIQSNFESAQQEVPHLHFHVVPRSKNDNLRYRFK